MSQSAHSCRTKAPLRQTLYFSPHRTFFAHRPAVFRPHCQVLQKRIFVQFLQMYFCFKNLAEWLTLRNLYLSLCFVNWFHRLRFFQVQAKTHHFFSHIAKVTFIFSALCYFDKIHLQFIENMLR